MISKIHYTALGKFLFKIMLVAFIFVALNVYNLKLNHLCLKLHWAFVAIDHHLAHIIVCIIIRIIEKIQETVVEICSSSQL